MYKHILIATDGSELASRGRRAGAVPGGASRRRGHRPDGRRAAGSEYRQVAVSAGMRDPVARYEQSVARQMKERFAEVESRSATKNVEVELLQEVDDSPAEAIVRAATARKCDLIVMASHGRRAVRELILAATHALARAAIALISLPDRSGIAIRHGHGAVWRRVGPDRPR